MRDRAILEYRREDRRRRRLTLVSGLMLVATLSVGVAACGVGRPGASPSASPSTTTTTKQNSSPHSTTPSSGTGSGIVSRQGSKAGNGSAGNESTGSYSLAFAQCMRTNGVSNFPNPHGSGELGPSSGIDPTSSAFQAALNGPCQSLAPPGWVASGPVSR